MDCWLWCEVFPSATNSLVLANFTMGFLHVKQHGCVDLFNGECVGIRKTKPNCNHKLSALAKNDHTQSKRDGIAWFKDFLKLHSMKTNIAFNSSLC